MSVKHNPPKKREKKPAAHEPDTFQKEAAPTGENEINTFTQESMETHAEHLHKAPGKGYWHYAFEFLMLFLAVFCGFLAEYRLEYKLDREKEKEFIVSLVNEMEADIVEINSIQNETDHYMRLDTLSRMLLNGNLSSETVKQCYRLYLNSSEMGAYVVFRRSTLTQLKSGGNMRLIRNNAVVDSILGIDGAISNIIDIQQVLEKTIYDNKRLAPEIFNMSYFIKNKEWANMDESLNSRNRFAFLTTDRVKLNMFGTYMLFQSGNLRAYMQRINNYKDYSVRIVKFLKEEYKLK
jgi:hypothetical protein